MCYNPTAVDYFGLPVNIGPDNPSDCPNTTPVTGAGDIKRSSIQSNCPTQFITTSPFGVKYVLYLFVYMLYFIVSTTKRFVNLQENIVDIMHQHQFVVH